MNENKKTADAVQGTFFDRFPPTRIVEQEREIARLEKERHRLQLHLTALQRSADSPVPSSTTKGI